MFYRYRSSSNNSGNGVDDWHYCKILSNLPIGIFRSTIDGRFIDVNPAMADLFGYDSVDEIVSIHTPDLYTDKSIRTSNIKKLIEGQDCIQFECQMLRKDGSPLWISSNVTAVRDEHNDLLHMEGALIDISRQVEAERQFEQSEKECRRLFNSVPIGLSVTDLGGEVIKANKSLIRSSGYTEEEFYKCHLNDFYYDPDDREHLLQELRIHGKVRDYKIRFVNKDGSTAIALLNSEVNDFGDGKVVYSSLRDITNVVDTRDALKESEKRFRLQHEQSPLSYQSLDKDGVIRDVNPAWLQMMGYTREEVIGSMFRKHLHGEGARIFIERFKSFLEIGEASGVPFEMIRKNGDLIRAELYGKVGHLGRDGEIQTHCILQDVTERVKMENRLRSSLREKDVLIGEIHHRVKNNLQVISSLLDFHANLIDDANAMDIFERCQRRIVAMSLIHEQLYRSSDFSQIDMKQYIGTLSEQLKTSYQPETSEVDLNLDVDDIILSIEQVIPCGLIINELIANTFKHAFPKSGSNFIEISLHRNGTDIELCIKDNGIGLPESINLSDPKTLGLQLVSLLVRQIKGTIMVSRENGASYRISFVQDNHRKTEQRNNAKE